MYGTFYPGRRTHSRPCPGLFSCGPFGASRVPRSARKIESKALCCWAAPERCCCFGFNVPLFGWFGAGSARARIRTNFPAGVAAGTALARADGREPSVDALVVVGQRGG